MDHPCHPLGSTKSLEEMKELVSEEDRDSSASYFTVRAIVAV